MKHMEQELISAKDGLKLYTQSWQVENPKALLCIVHGMGEHSGRYATVVDFFNSKQISVFAYDQRGHGKTPGKRGHTPHYDFLLADLDQFVNHVAKSSPNIPILLYGHSMGGNVVLNYALKMQKNPHIKGIISSSAFLKLAFEPSAIQVALGKMVKSIFPGFIQNTNLDVSALSRDAEVVKAYQNDPLVHGKISATFFFGLMDASTYALQNADKMPYPLCIFHGNADRLTDYKGTEQFISVMKEKPVSRIFEGSFHEIHHDLNKQELFDFLNDWIQKIV